MICLQIKEGEPTPGVLPDNSYAKYTPISAFSFVCVRRKEKSYKKRNAITEGSAPPPRHPLKKVGENFLLRCAANFIIK